MFGIYVNGNRRNVGTTFISTGLAITMQSLDYDTGYFKPIQLAAHTMNGFLQSPDLFFVGSMDPYLKTYGSYIFHTDAEPVIAAEMENEYISKAILMKDFQTVTNSHDCVIIDSSVGLASKLNINFSMYEYVKALNLPIVQVVKPDENAFSETIMNLNFINQNELNFRGVIINNFTDNSKNYYEKTLARLIEEYTDAKILGIMPEINNISVNPNELINHVLNGIDVEAVFDLRIEKLVIG